MNKIGQNVCENGILFPHGKRCLWRLLLLGALLGTAFFLVVYGTASLCVTSDGWIMYGHVESDITCDYAGWIQYRNAPWAWPLGVNLNIGYPYGNAIAVSGPMAPFAFLFKLLSPLLPETFQFYGWWALLCYILQGQAAVLLGSLFTKKLLPLTAIALLFISAPILGERAFRHCSLMIHFVVLLGFYLYVQANRGNRKGQWWKYMLLNTVALTVFPYFYPIVLGIMTASLLQDVCTKTGRKRFVGTWVASTTVPIACAWMCGMFYSKTSVARDGYGIYSMNVSQPLNPVSYGGIQWSRVLSQRPTAVAQYDGFNYLGLGVLLGLPLLLLAFVLIERRRALPKLAALCKRHWALLLVAIGFAVYAISNVIYWDDTLVFSYSLPSIASVVTGLFRASGRIFYGTYYFLYLLLIAGICKLCKEHGRILTVVLCLLVAVQLWDISPGYQWKHAYFAQDYSNVQSKYDTDVLKYVGEHYEKLIFLEIHDYNKQDMSVLIGKEGLVTNFNTSPVEDIYNSDLYVAEQLAMLRAGEIDTTTAYVITQEAILEELLEINPDTLVRVSDGNWNYLLPVLPDSTPPESGPLIHDP